jgi:hypothetical protein
MNTKILIGVSAILFIVIVALAGFSAVSFPQSDNIPAAQLSKPLADDSAESLTIAKHEVPDDLRNGFGDLVIEENRPRPQKCGLVRGLLASKRPASESPFYSDNGNSSGK